MTKKTNQKIYYLENGKTNPYLTTVIVCRNDRHQGVSFLEKLQVFVKVFCELSEKFELDSEVVIVEWNPLENMPRLKDALEISKHKLTHIRIIEVPSEIHNRLKIAKNYPLHQWIGKNVGIRRALGKYVLVTNADDVFSESLICFLSQKKLQRDCFYRVNMFNVKSPIPLDKPAREILEYCERNILKTIDYFGSYKKKISLEYAKCLYAYIKNKLKYYPFSVPHTNAAGDFILMHRENWAKLRGFIELDTPYHYPYADGLMVNIALFSGWKQIILDEPIYHLDHQQVDLPMCREISQIYEKVVREKRPLIPNTENWGLGDVVLEEIQLEKI